jgi:hypothetical protein
VGFRSLTGVLAPENGDRNETSKHRSEEKNAANRG